MRHALFLFMGCLGLSGCALATGPGLGNLAAGLPSAYPHASVPQQTADLQGRWWTAFGDPKLDRLVDQVLAQNRDLAAAAILVRRARLTARLAGDPLLPHLTAGVSGEAGRDDAGSRNTFGASAAVAYEVDPFARLAAARDAARWEAAATEEDRQAAALSLVGETLQLYWSIGYLNARITSATQSLAYTRDLQRLVQAQKSAGAVSAVEVSESILSVQDQTAALSALVQQRVESRAALTLLLGGAAWPMTDELQTLPLDTLPILAAGLPADLLARRPDVRAAELRLREQLSVVQGARASFYPQISLTGAAGGSSASLSTILADPATSLGVGISLPFLNWNALSLNLKTARLDQERAVLLFRQALLAAFIDVDNALSAQQQLAAQGRALSVAQDAATRAERLYGVRYRSGAVALRIWLDAQEARRRAEIAALDNLQTRLVNQATLYQALGGAASPGP